MGRLFKGWTRAALAAGWVLLAGGCAAPASAPVPAAPGGAAAPARPSPPQPQPQPPADNRFVIAPELAGVLRVVSVSLHNPPGHFLNIARRPREVLPIAATAPSPAAVDFGIAFLPTVK
jgi:hypothetical protein